MYRVIACNDSNVTWSDHERAVARAIADTMTIGLQVKGDTIPLYFAETYMKAGKLMFATLCNAPADRISFSLVSDKKE